MIASESQKARGPAPNGDGDRGRRGGGNRAETEKQGDPVFKALGPRRKCEALPQREWALSSRHAVPGAGYPSLPLGRR